MSSIPTATGFFGSNGTLTSNAFKTSGYEEWSKSRAAGIQSRTLASSANIEDQVESDVAAQITEAAVVKISSRLDVGNTGFDKGVSDYVNAAVSLALKKTGNQSSPDTGSSAPREIGGSFQNELIAQSDAARAPVPAEDTPPPSNDTATTPPPPAPADEMKNLAKKHIENYEKHAGRKLSDDEKKQRIDDVAKFYSQPGREGRLQAMVDVEA